MLSQEFAASGHEVRVVTWSGGSSVEAKEFEVIRRPSLMELFHQHRWADIVYENNPCFRLSWPAIVLRKRTVVAFHTWLSGTTWKSKFVASLKRIFVRRARATIAVSDAIRQDCCPSAVVLGNPYRNDVFRRLPAVTRDKSFVFLGRLVSDKGADMAVALIAELNRHHGTNHTLTIIGDGPEKTPLQRLARSLQIEDQVQILWDTRWRTFNRVPEPA